MLVNEGLMGCDPHGQCAVELIHDLVRGRALAWAPSLGIAWKKADGALDQAGGLQALCKGRQGLLRIGGTGKACAGLEGFDFLRTVFQQLFVHSALRLRLTRLGVDEDPALLDTAISG